MDDLICRDKNGERLYSLQDANWNCVATVNETGTVQERYVYDAFGNVNGLNSDWNRTFTGQVLDAETGLMLYRNRFYSTELGRFLQRDPIGYDAGDWNVYRYVGNRVVTVTDLFGLQFGIPSPMPSPKPQSDPVYKPPVLSHPDPCLAKAEELCNQHLASDPMIRGGVMCVNGKSYVCIRHSNKYPGIPCTAIKF